MLELEVASGEYVQNVMYHKRADVQRGLFYVLKIFIAELFEFNVEKGCLCTFFMNSSGIKGSFEF